MTSEKLDWKQSHTGLNTEHRRGQLSGDLNACIANAHYSTKVSLLNCRETLTKHFNHFFLRQKKHMNFINIKLSGLVGSCLVTSSSHQLPCYCVPGSKDCCYIRMTFFHCSIAHCWLTGMILLGQQWSQLLDCSASPTWPEQLLQHDQCKADQIERVPLSRWRWKTRVMKESWVLSSSWDWSLYTAV